MIGADDPATYRDAYRTFRGYMLARAGELVAEAWQRGEVISVFVTPKMVEDTMAAAARGTMPR